MNNKDNSTKPTGDIQPLPGEDRKHYVYPSKLKRFIVLVVWYFITVIVLMFLAHIIAENLFNVPESDLNDNARMPEWFRIVKYIIQFGPLLVLFILASKGMLPGAMRKLKV